MPCLITLKSKSCNKNELCWVTTNSYWQRNRSNTIIFASFLSFFRSKLDIWTKTLCKHRPLLWGPKGGRLVEVWVYVLILQVTVADMLANVGGTFGLFLGLSFLSIFEISLEIFFYIKKKIPPTYAIKKK